MIDEKVRQFVFLKDGKYSWNLDNPIVIKHLNIYSDRGFNNPFRTNEFFKIVLGLTFGLSYGMINSRFTHTFKIGDSFLKMGNVWKIQRTDGMIIMVEDMREIFDYLNFVEGFKIGDNGDVSFGNKGGK